LAAQAGDDVLHTDRHNFPKTHADGGALQIEMAPDDTVDGTVFFDF
jgi:hypothetical protein